MKKILLVVILIIITGCSMHKKESEYEFVLINKSNKNIYFEVTGKIPGVIIKRILLVGADWKIEIPYWADETGTYINSLKIYEDKTKSKLLYSYNKSDADAVYKIERDFLLDEGIFSLQITNYLIR